MTTKTTISKLESAKKAYQTPQLKPLGSVKELTLKIGSISDGSQPGFA
jgi:hypothetical protein